MRGADLIDTDELLDHLRKGLRRAAHYAAALDEANAESWALSVDLGDLAVIVEVLEDRHRFKEG